MKMEIDKLLRYGSTPEYQATPLSPQRQERILLMTMKKIKSEQKQAAPRSRKPITMLVAAAAIVMLLCGSVFAAYELKLFDFSQLFGENSSIIEEAVAAYTPEPEAAVSALSGLTEGNHASREDYNFTLLGDVEVSDTLICATIDISKVSEDVPDFTEAGLSLGIEGYASQSFDRGWGGQENRFVVYAPLTEPLSEGDTVNLVMTDGTSSTTILADTPITLTDANAAVFPDPTADADYVLDTASLIGSSLTVTGHFQKEFDDYAAALDASGAMTFGGISWPLLDQFADTYDPNDGNDHEDLEGYLAVRDVAADGSFTLEWVFVKDVPQELGMTITFGGERYVIPEQEAEAQPAEEYTPNLATSAETQDYRFSLESMVAASNTIYAIVDMEPITDYGAAHMNLGSQELNIVCSNLTHQDSGSVGSILIESGDDISRYLVYSLDDTPGSHQAGDIISFQILNITEDGDTAEHSYALFDVALETVISASADAERRSGTSNGPVDYTTVTVTPLSLYLEGQYEGTANEEGLAAADQAMNTPEIVLGFKDGSSYTIMDEAWQPDPDNTGFGEYGVVVSSVRADGAEDSGVIYKSFLFSQVVSLEELDTITIDGVVYQVNYEIG